jgi:bifunctional non-homologous end joining protein LigD
MSQAQRERRGQPDWIAPQLATLTKDRFSDPAWIFERKLDGERCLAFGRGGQVHLLTRNQKPANAAYPELAGAWTKRRRTRSGRSDGRRPVRPPP